MERTDIIVGIAIVLLTSLGILLIIYTITPRTTTALPTFGAVDFRSYVMYNSKTGDIKADEILITITVNGTQEDPLMPRIYQVGTTLWVRAPETSWDPVHGEVVFGFWSYDDERTIVTSPSMNITIADGHHVWRAFYVSPQQPTEVIIHANSTQ